MKTITPAELQKLIDKSPVELVDVRPKKDFEKVHALGARSIPLSDFEPHSVLAHRKLDRHAPLYLICRRKTLASLAACSLAGAGLDEPIVVEGGLEAWEKLSLPVKRKKSWRRPVIDWPVVMLPGGLLAGLAVGFALGFGLAFHGFFFFVPLLLFAAWAVPRALRFAHDRSRDVDGDRWHGAQVAKCR